jgi:hypothetical protein
MRSEEALSLMIDILEASLFTSSSIIFSSSSSKLMSLRFALASYSSSGVRAWLDSSWLMMPLSLRSAEGASGSAIGLKEALSISNMIVSSKTGYIFT